MGRRVSFNFKEFEMDMSRRNLLQGAGMGLALTAFQSGTANADGAASTANATDQAEAPARKKLDLISFDLLE